MSEYYGVSTSTESFLTHYGIKGMRWGVRKMIDRPQTGGQKTKAYSDAEKKLKRVTNKNNKVSSSQLRREAMDAGEKARQAHDNLSFLGKHGYGKTAKAYREARREATNATSKYYDSLSKKEYAKLRKRHYG